MTSCAVYRVPPVRTRGTAAPAVYSCGAVMELPRKITENEARAWYSSQLSV